MKYSPFFLFSFVFCLLLQPVQAQYNQYAQFHNSPMLVNPAWAASSSDLSLLLHYRQESLGNGFRYTNPMFSALYPFVNGTTGERWGGVSLGLIQDQTEVDGTNALQTTGGMLGYAHNVNLGNDYFLSFGAQVAYYQRSLTTADLLSRTRILTGSENDLLLMGMQEKGIFSITPGLMWYKSDGVNPKSYVSLASYHLNRPELKYSDTGESANLPIQWVLAGAWEFWRNESITLQANGRWLHEQGSNHYNVGVLSNYLFSNIDRVGLGVWASNRLAVVSVEGSLYNVFVGVSYEIPFEGQNRGSTPEVVLGYRKQLSAKSK